MKRVLFKSRPGANNEPTEANFAVETCDCPPEPGPGEMTIRSLYISLDPALRCRMNEDAGVDYMKSWQIGETVLGLGGVGMVTRSNNPDYTTGDLVHGLMNWPWVEEFNCTSNDPYFQIQKIDKSLSDRPQLVLSLLGMTGLTSYHGIVERGHIKQGAGQCCVVSGAAGACGNLAGQIAKLSGASQVVGICGSDKKCAYLKEQCGFDDAINYKTENVSERLKQICTQGIHSYFDNVGGSLSEAVIEQMSEGSHVILCGQIAVYNKDLPYPPPISQHITDIIAQKHITRERFLVLQYQEKFPEGLKQLQEWCLSGKLKVPEYIHEGLDRAGEAFVNMMTSRNQEHVGKQMVKITQQ